jgi:rare lipoprotein A
MTANGEAFNPNGLSAAHKHLPLPMFVRVTNLANRRSIVVRVNDRGPFVKGRIIDLSAGAAKKLGFYKQGTARVLVEAVQLKG